MRNPTLTLQDFVARGTAAGSESWSADLVKLNPGEGSRLRARCAELNIDVCDSIQRQLADLAQIRLPRAGQDEERNAFVRQLIQDAGEADAYGSWAYFPWARQMVHVLERDAFLDVITSRNCDKITVQEQRQLITRTVGVIGLSVGGEAAVTIAQEHLCGRMVIADFDRLDLSNLNRLNAGVEDLGVLKTTIVARRIARINPYLDIEVYPDGVTDSNVNAFLDGLDLLVEECDGLGLKFTIRELARARRLNVIYAADELGFLSVEPYGDVPALPLFHGLVPEPHPPRHAFPSALKFFQALTEWIGGWSAISERSRQSLARVGTELSGYPQLAGEARFAAGQLAHCARRLLLGEHLRPYVGNVDLHTIVTGRI